MKNLIRLIITAFTSMLIAYFIEKATYLIRLFEDIQSSFENYDFTDHYFNSNPFYPPDSNIVMVNIGEYSRREIANMLDIVNVNHPKVIGMTVSFNSLENSAGDTILSTAIRKSKNLVLSINDDSGRTHPFIRNDAREGIVNVLFEDNLTIRSFKPVSIIDSAHYIHQAVVIAEIYDPD